MGSFWIGGVFQVPGGLMGFGLSGSFALVHGKNGFIPLRTLNITRSLATIPSCELRTAWLSGGGAGLAGVTVLNEKRLC